MIRDDAVTYYIVLVRGGRTGMVFFFFSLSRGFQPKKNKQTNHDD